MYKTDEQIWEEVGFTPSFDKDKIEEYKMWFKGYIMAYFLELYHKKRDVVCVNVNIFENQNEAHDYINRCCISCGCKIIGVDKGELWITRSDYKLSGKVIPSRFTTDPEAHKIRGKLLGYPKEVIDNYVLIQEDKNE